MERDELIWVGLADRSAGIADDVVLGLQRGIVGHQFKTSKFPKAFRLDSFLLGADGLLAPLASSCQRLRQAHPADVVEIRVVTNDFPSSSDKLTDDDHSAAFAREFELYPKRFDVLEYPAGEECQVDFGQGAPTRVAGGKYRRPHLFVMTLKYSGKSFRKVVWKADQHVWARLHEEAWRSFGGCCTYVVLDNLRQGVIKPDLYEPQINSVYAALLAHYGVVADVCRVRDPNRKGTVEGAIQHTQSTALKGLRFESIEEQNAKLAYWEERWAASRIHGRKKRQVLEMYS